MLFVLRGFAAPRGGVRSSVQQAVEVLVVPRTLRAAAGAGVRDLLDEGTVLTPVWRRLPAHRAGRSLTRPKRGLYLSSARQVRQGFHFSSYRPASGSSMPTPRTRKLWLAVSAGTFALLLVAVTVGFRRPPVETPVAQFGELDLTSQPIQFPHDTHAGQFTMSCQYCHFSAERSVDAGIPPVSLCMGCHLEGIVGGRTDQAQAEIGKLRSYYAAGTPIPWKRIYKVSDHVSFPHMRHVAAGVTCQTCHGDVQEMGVLEVVAPEAGDLRMGWCVSCHLERGASRDCTVCHY